MKIKQKTLSYDEVMSLPVKARKKPLRTSYFFRLLLKTLSEGELKSVNFTYEIKSIPEKETPCLFLMNHSSFIDLKIASKILFPRPFNIVCTSDGFVGKEWLMRHLGCIPTQKFVTDLFLVKDMFYAVRKLKTSVLLYPEASYTFDGRATPLPESVGKMIKFLGVPVVMIKTDGAFLRDPLYNNLQVRKVNVSATVETVINAEETASLSAEEINSRVGKHFAFDNFKDQLDSGTEVNEPFRADGLNRILYKCPHCNTEGKTEGKGIRLYCYECNKEYELTPSGQMKAVNGETEFSHIPDWYDWERESVKNEIYQGKYRLDIPVEIKILKDTDYIYSVGSGRLEHTVKGFHLTGCDGKLDFFLPSKASYGLYSDYFWYEIGDMICIGDMKNLYYCFPTEGKDVVAKTRLATEEIYKYAKVIPRS